MELSEHQKILDHVTDSRFTDLLTVAWEVGPRPEEIVKVEARHIDLQEACWIFPRHEAKIKKQERVVYLNDTALEICKRLVKEWPKGPIFRNTRGRPWTPFAVNCRFNRLKKKLNRKYCLYLYRHSWCDRALKAGISPLEVSIAMGHVDQTMVYRTYSHVHHDKSHMKSVLSKM